MLKINTFAVVEESDIPLQIRNSYPYNMQTVIQDYLDSVNDEFLEFINNVENGDYSFRRYNKIWVVTAYMQKNTVTQAPDAKSPKPHALNALASPVFPNNNVSQSNTVVNNNSMQEKENDTDIQHSFGGRGAENADLSLLEKAIKINDEGKSSEETLKRKTYFGYY